MDTLERPREADEHCHIRQERFCTASLPMGETGVETRREKGGKEKRRCVQSAGLSQVSS